MEGGKQGGREGGRACPYVSYLFIFTQVDLEAFKASLAELD